MNKKGFTLVELLAVILILSSISIVAVVSITSSLGRRDVKECEEQKELAINAAKIYFSLNNASSVSVGTLKSGNYFNEKSKTDRLKDSLTISLAGNEYKVYDNGTEFKCYES